ncbi:hypothetical protein [Agathobaculum sp.]|uniref:hypothetical protein n=1 Tax=Agathobaculum sp. TaxID=2048138 RepID=UPI0035210257
MAAIIATCDSAQCGSDFLYRYGGNHLANSTALNAVVHFLYRYDGGSSVQCSNERDCRIYDRY